MSDAIKQRQDSQKAELIDQLKKTPIVEYGCKKVGIGRATYYRWRKDDEVFSKLTDEAMRDGSELINEMAESQLIAAIKDRNLTAIIYWLKHHHPQYATKVEVTAKIQNLNPELTPEQKKVVEEALRLASLTDDPGDRKEQ